MTAGATQKELARQIKFLKVENEILRSPLPNRITVTPKERHRFVRFAQKLVDDEIVPLGEVRCKQRLGGPFKSYSRKAA